MKRITLTRPDDWHLHVRDGAMLKAVLPHTAARFGRAIIMPNIVPPCRRIADASAYYNRIKQALPEGSTFEPLMVLYATDDMDADEIYRAAEGDLIKGVKLYPAGATTHSNDGVTHIRHLDTVLKAMEEVGMPLLVHGEVTQTDIDIFDREAVFIDSILQPTIDRFPKLKIVLEHITTKEAVAFVRQADAHIAATLTVQHLMLNRNAIFENGIRPHHYCLPILKRESHRQALLDAATSGEAKFFLGTDSAPHAKNKKESACGCAGIYTAFAAIELYTQIFAEAHALDKLEAFSSLNGPRFYGLPVNQDKITLINKPWQVPEAYYFGNETLVPFMAKQTLNWQLDQPLA